MRPDPGQRGFTIIELTVVLGLLAAFMLFLTQLLSTGVSLFDEGQAGQELSDLGDTAAAAVQEGFDDMAGPRDERYEPGRPDARLIVEWVPLGLGEPERAAARVQAVRATVHLPAAIERALRRPDVVEEVRAAGGTAGEGDVERRVEERLRTIGLEGRGEMLLLPWPAGDPDDQLLELRLGRWLPGTPLRVDGRRSIQLMDCGLLPGALPPPAAAALTAPIASGLLHFEIALRSQYTRDLAAGPGDSGPEWVWDSARAGLLAEAKDRSARFGLDLGAASLEDTTDDVFPREVLVTLVVAGHTPPARLAAAVTATDRELRLLTSRPLPHLEDDPWLKIGSEWVRYGSAADTVLTGVRRGERGTKAVGHPAGTVVRQGRTVTLRIAVPHGRDCWNG